MKSGGMNEEEKKKLYEEVRPVALEFRKSFINEGEVIKDAFQMIERLGFCYCVFQQ